MRLLLDLQCVQSTSAIRGIGRYALALSRALVATAGPDDRVEVLLNGGDDPERLLRARTALETFVPARAVHVFDAPWPWRHDPDPRRRREAEAVRAAAVDSLRPDALLVGSVFEGDKENVLSVEPAGVPTAALLYDLIPATDPGTYLLGPGADSYWRRYEDLKRVDLLLSISAYTAQQARDLLGRTCPPVVPIWGGPYPSGLFATFERRDTAVPPQVPERYLLAVGGDHPRKNLDRLVEAWGQVGTRQGTALVIACRLNVGTLRRLRRLAGRAGLLTGELVLTGEVSETDLDALYRGALGFVFPSTEEGLGMPPLEAMAAGCPTVLARGSSLSELVDDPDAYFDGTDVGSIAFAMSRMVDDLAFREQLRSAAATSRQRFTWEAAAELAWEALRQLPAQHGPVPEPVQATVLTAVPSEPVAELVAVERELGIDTTLPAGVAATLMTQAALVVPDDGVARQLVRAGIVDQPVLTDPRALHRVADHDLYGALRQRLPEPVWPDDLVSAVARPPRWSLQRPRPVWLVLTAVPVAARPELTHVDIVTGRPGAVVLARACDRVVVEAALVPELLGDLHRARCLGTAVTVVGPGGPAWVTTAPDLMTALAEEPRRTTGWPWGG